MTDLSFANLVDIDQIRELLEAHYKITGVCAGILDTDENILVAVGYHDICTRFHLVHPVAKLNCRESDAYIKAHLSECSDGYLDYRCKNGLVDVAFPIIIRDVHLATFFTGQFFYDDDRLDVEFFRNQAEKFGFDETGYLQALGRVPVFTREHIHNVVNYYRHLVKIITQMGLKNLELRNDAAERNQAEEERRKSEENFSIIFQATPDLIAITRAGDGTILEVNEAFSRLLGYSRAEAIGKCTEELFIWADPADRARWMAALEATGQVNEFETTLRCRDGSLITCVSTARPLDFGGKKCVLSVVRDITERKAAESALRLSQYIIDNASIGIMRGNDDAKILSANEHWAGVLGYSQEELCTMSFFDIDPNLTPESWLELRGRLTATGFNTFESLQRRKDGKTFPVEVTVNYLKFGEEVFGCSFIRDISERKRAEEELRKSRQMLMSVLDNFPGVVFWKDCNSVYMGCNKNFSLAAGLSEPSEIVGRSDYDLPWKNDAERYLADDRQVIESGVPKLNIIEPLPHADGRIARFETSKVPLFDADGKVFAVLGASNDITECVNAEETLRMSQFIIDKASFGILRGQADAKILYANEYAARMLGYTQDELCSMSFFDIDQSLTPAFWQEHRKEVTATGTNTFESVHRRKDGTKYPVEVMVNYQKFQGREFSCSFFRDITERKRAEEALQKSRNDLEISVRERTEQLTSLTAELSLAEERERRRIATELHDQVGQTLIFSKIKLDSISHSLPSESFEKQIGEIRKYLDQSIQDIRSLTFQLSPPLLYEVGFEAAVEWLGEEFEEKYGLHVEFQDDGKKKPLAEEASVALYQIVRELLLNVAKHAKAKKVKISVGKISGKIKISIADDGSGFDSLNSMQRKNKKSGFGLFNIRQRIEYLGGEFLIESEIGCGTRATLLLPLKKKMMNRKIP